MTDQQYIGGALRKNPDRNDAGYAVDACFHLYRIGNLQVMHVQNVITIIRDKSFAPDWSAAHLHYAPCDKFLCHRDDFDGERETSEHTDELGVVNNADKTPRRRGKNLFAGQCAAAAFYQLKVLVSFVGPVDIEVERRALIETDDFETTLFQKRGRGSRARAQ